MDGHDRMRALFDDAAGHAPDAATALEDLGPRFVAARRRRQATQGALALAAVLGVVGAGAALWQPDPGRTVVAVVPTSDGTEVTLPSPPSTVPVTAAPDASVTPPDPAAPPATTVAPPATTVASGGTPAVTSGGTPAVTPPATTGTTPPTAGTVPPVPPAPSAPTSVPATASSTSTSTPGSTTVGSTPGSALPAPVERTAVCAGGSVRARWTGTTMQVVAVTPVAGATVEETTVDDDEVEVRFRLGDGRTSRAWVEVEDGAVVTDCDDDD